MGKLILGILLICISSCLYSQTTISGFVKEKNTALSISANLVLKNDKGKTITYTFSNNKGYYSIEVDSTGKFVLSASSLGYTIKAKTIFITPGITKINTDFFLTRKAVQLKEVVIQEEKPITVKKDTIVFNTKFFTNGTEQTVEELLKKIPGLHIDNRGNIKVGNQEIEKLMVEGDDFFGKGYKILSKNMPAYPIGKVEVLKHYSNNKLLKGVEESNKVALNLKLKEDVKRVWFGNLIGAVGNDGFYKGALNLMNFGKKNKYYFLTNLNNIENNTTGNIERLTYSSSGTASIGDYERVQLPLGLSIPSLNFKQDRSTFSNTKLISLNAIFNPTDKLKIKPVVFLDWNKTDFFRNTTEKVNTNATNFTNKEDYHLHNKKRIAFGKLDIKYELSKTQMIKATTKYNNGDLNNGSNLIFNGSATIERLKQKNTLFDQKISYTNKFDDKKVLLLTGRFINEKKPQDYHVNRFFFSDLFPQDSLANAISQTGLNQMNYMGINAHLLDRRENGDLLELQLGNEYRKDKLFTIFSLLKDNTLLEHPKGYQNHTDYQVNDLYFKGKYRWEFNNFGITGKLGIHQLSQQLNDYDNTSSKNHFFVKPSVAFDWKINRKNRIRASYSYTETNAKILDVYNHFVLTGFRSFKKGTGDFNQLHSSHVVFNYQFGNWLDRFFASAVIVYDKNYDYLSTNTYLKQNYTQSEKIRINNQHFLTINAKLNYYFSHISSNLKLNLGYTQTNFKNIINNSNLRQIKSNNYHYGLELRSGFNGVFNYHIGTKWVTSQLKTGIKQSYTNNISFLNVSFILSDKLNAQIQTERYYFDNIEKDNTYYFLDFDIRYKFIDNKLNIGLSGKNLFDTKTFKNFSISDIGSTTTTYRLLPRFFLLTAEYRF